MNEEELFRYFISRDVKPDRARELAARLALINIAGWTNEQVGKYSEEWGNIALSEQYQDAMAMYDVYHDPKTGRLLTDVRAEQERTRRQVFESATFSAIDRIEQRKRQEAEAAQAAQQGKPQTFVEATAPTLEALRGQISPAAQRYFRDELGNIFAQEGMPEARREWWEEKTRFMPEVEGVGGEDWWKMTPEEIAAAEEPVVSRQEELTRRQSLEDPWLKFLREFPFREKFQSLTPRERGAFSGQFRPKTRFL